MSVAWPTWENIKWVLTVLAIPLALAWVSRTYERTALQHQALEARLRLYTELLSKREEADTNIRKDMFGKVLETFLRPGDSEVDQQLLKIELMAANFHESLDLSPLFRRLEAQIKANTAPNKPELIKALESTARDVKERQIEMLELVGAKRDGTVDFETLAEGKAISIFDEELEFEEPVATNARARKSPRAHKRHFNVEALEWDQAGRRLLIRTHDGSRQWMFWLDAFDFPLVDFTRISGTERFTVALRTVSSRHAELSFIYFPSSRSGVKDKPYIDEVVAGLVSESP
jgi:hypothetical protein